MDEQEGRECPKNPPRIRESSNSRRIETADSAGLPSQGHDWRPARRLSRGRLMGLKSLAALNDLIQRTAGRAIAAEKDMVEFAANQNKAVSEAIKRQAETAGTPVVATATEMMQHAVDALLENQREFLDVAAKLSKTIAAKA